MGSPISIASTVAVLEVYGERAFSPGSLNHNVPEWVALKLKDDDDQISQIRYLGGGDEVYLYHTKGGTDIRRLIIREPAEPCDSPPNPMWFSFWAEGELENDVKCILRVPIAWVIANDTLKKTYYAGINTRLALPAFELGPTDLYETFGFEDHEVEEIRALAAMRGLL